ncbi:hypothetical protein [Bacillus phage vB_BanS-Thrax2]|nr:hypothetical protein [Bacillus phage vB_BanS-Thrax2]
MNEKQVELLTDKVRKFIDSQDLDYNARVNCFEEKGIIYVAVDAWQVTEDTRGCYQEIIRLVEWEFDELKNDDVECHEMVFVTFKVDGFEGEDDDE